MTQQAAPGWHGKLPSLGDFASRRLDQDFLGLWDEWLAAGMLALREQLGTVWLDAYLASPSWRFLLMPGALRGATGAQAWAGVLMPSVDRVGRYFPFTIVRPLGTEPFSTLQMPALWHWLSRLDDLAADALHEDWSVERLEEELARMAPPDWPHLPSSSMTEEIVNPEELRPVDLPSGQGPADWIGAQAHSAWRQRNAGLAYWYSSAEQHAPRLLRSRGLPASTSMNVLFGGSTP